MTQALEALGFHCGSQLVSMWEGGNGGGRSWAPRVTHCSLGILGKLPWLQCGFGVPCPAGHLHSRLPQQCKSVISSDHTCWSPLSPERIGFLKKKKCQISLCQVEEVIVHDGKWKIWAMSSAEPCRQVSHTLGTAATRPRSASSPCACTTCWSLLGGECHTSGYLEYVRMWPGFQNKLLVILTVFNVQLFFCPPPPPVVFVSHSTSGGAH